MRQHDSGMSKQFRAVAESHGVVAVAAVLLFCGTAVDLSAEPVRLPVINAGFETGVFNPWVAAGNAAPYITFQDPYSNHWAAGLPGPGTLPPDLSATLTQNDISMPDAPDVRWSFWAEVSGTCYDPGTPPSSCFFFGPDFTASIQRMDNTGTITFRVRSDGLQTVPAGWTVTPWPWGGFIVQSGNLRDTFSPGDSLRIQFSAGAHMLFTDGPVVGAFATVDDVGPQVPEPSSVLLVGLGALGLATRARAFRRKNKA